MLTTKDDWSHLTLDVYPSQRYSVTILYEDDTVSNDYKKGLYRTTNCPTISIKTGMRRLSLLQHKAPLMVTGPLQPRLDH